MGKRLARARPYHLTSPPNCTCDAGRAASGDERILCGPRMPKVPPQYNYVGAVRTGPTGAPPERASSVRA